MARKEKAKRKKRSNKSKGSSNFPVKAVMLSIICAIFLTGIFFGLKYFFLYSQYFVVKNVVVNSDQKDTFRWGEEEVKRRYTGDNIFAVNLKHVQLFIERTYPQLKKVEIKRDLPDTIGVNIVSRRAIAVIDTSGGVVIDSDGVVLSIGKPKEDLTAIKGINFKSPTVGQKLYNKPLNKTLALVQAVHKKIPSLHGEVIYVDISNSSNVLLNVSGVLIKMGLDNFSRKIEILKNITKDPDVNMKDLKYIDLRFDEIVMAPK